MCEAGTDSAAPTGTLVQQLKQRRLMAPWDHHIMKLGRGAHRFLRLLFGQFSLNHCCKSPARWQASQAWMGQFHASHSWERPGSRFLLHQEHLPLHAPSCGSGKIASAATERHMCSNSFPTGKAIGAHALVPLSRGAWGTCHVMPQGRQASS